MSSTVIHKKEYRLEQGRTEADEFILRKSSIEKISCIRQMQGDVKAKVAKETCNKNVEAKVTEEVATKVWKQKVTEETETKMRKHKSNRRN